MPKKLWRQDAGGRETKACAICYKPVLPKRSKYAACPDCRKKHADDPLLSMFFKEPTRAEREEGKRKTEERLARNREHDANMRKTVEVRRLMDQGKYDEAQDLLNSLPPYYRHGNKVR